MCKLNIKAVPYKLMGPAESLFRQEGISCHPYHLHHRHLAKDGKLTEANRGCECMSQSEKNRQSFSHPSSPPGGAVSTKVSGYLNETLHIAVKQLMVIDGTRPWFPQFLWFRGKGWGSEEWRWLDGTKKHTKNTL